MIEQPLPADDLVGHAMVQELVRTPVCLDESITTPAQAAMALDLHSCRYVNLKPGRVGGLTPAAAISRRVPRAVRALLRWRGPAERHRRAVRICAGVEGQLHLSGRLLSRRRRACLRPR